MFSRGLLTVAHAACRFLLRLFLRLLPVIVVVGASVELFSLLAQQAAGQPPAVSILMKLTGWVFSAFLWLLFAWFSVFTSYLTCPGRRLNRLLALAYLQRSLSSGS